MSRDPFGGQLQSPGSLHQYLYANADPVDYTDPTGLESLLELSISQVISTTLSSSSLDGGSRRIAISRVELRPLVQLCFGEASLAVVYWG